MQRILRRYGRKKYCPNCGNQLKDNARFCGKCGNAVRELKPAEPPVIEETEKPVIKPVKQKKKNRHLPFILAMVVTSTAGGNDEQSAREGNDGRVS